VDWLDRRRDCSYSIWFIWPVGYKERFCDYGVSAMIEATFTKTHESSWAMRLFGMTSRWDWIVVASVVKLLLTFIVGLIAIPEFAYVLVCSVSLATANTS
jgi:hypothetical protein